MMHLFPCLRKERQTDELELTAYPELTVPLVNNTSDQLSETRTIARCSTKSKISLVEEDLENEGHLSIKSGNLKKKHPRFGPCYGIDHTAMSDIKKRAMEHVLQETLPQDPSEVKEIYTAAMRNVERAALNAYADKLECSTSDFRWMMINDGCFFLQLALMILGSPEQLGYPNNHLFFGKKLNKEQEQSWIVSMFFVGNQVPFVAIKVLLAQDFFKRVLAKGKWQKPHPSSFCKNILYELLILPSRKGQNIEKVKQMPSDLLHGLHNLVLGPGTSMNKSVIYGDTYEFDLEANQDTGIATITDKNTQSFPSAVELRRKRIFIRKLKEGGVRSIHFTSYYFWAYLYLPVLPVHNEIDIIFQNLKLYERQLEMEKRDVNSYLRFMADIVPTSSDVNLLEMTGVVQSTPEEKEIIQSSTGDKEKLPEMLRRLSGDDIRLTQDFRILRQSLRDYSGPPWSRVKNILNLVAILSLLQTFFTMLAYFKPPKSS